MNRFQRLRDYLKLQENQAVLIHKPSNFFYLSGYTGEGLILILKNDAYIITDFRYVEQAEKEAPGVKVASIAKGRNHITIAGEIVLSGNVKTVFYEDDFVTVVQHKAMQEAMPGIVLSSLNGAPEQLRRVKDEEELAKHRKACSISCDALDYMLGKIKPGMTEKQVMLMLEYKMFELGAEGLAFHSIVASGVNGSLPHAVPSDKVIEKGELLTLDFGAKYQGYCADMTRTLAIGDPSAKLREIYHIVLDAQQTSQAALAPGKVCSSIDKIARDMIAEKGYGEYFGHGLGHGVGIDVHEMPSMSYACQEILQPGHVVTIEPGIYIPGLGGVRIENTCEITENGAKSMVYAPRELIVL